MGEGHEVKSRAARTVVEACVIASLSARDSRQIDLPNGGDIVIRGNVLGKGPNSDSHEVIGIGLERGRGHGEDHELNRAVIENNTVVDDRRGRVQIVASRDVPAPVLRGNRLIVDREKSELPPFPFLPDVPLSSEN